MSPKDKLIDALQDCLEPEAVVAIASRLTGPITEVGVSVKWFCDTLIEAVGGVESYNRILCEMEGGE